MIKRAIAALFIVLAGFFVLVGVPQAQARPLSMPCASGCFGAQTWDISGTNTHGGLTVSTVEDPNGATFTSWDERLVMFGPNGVVVVVGMQKGTGASGSGGPLTWFILYDDGHGLNSGGAVSEGTVPSGDYNSSVNLGISYVTTGTSNLGLDLWIYADHNNSTICFPCNIGTNTYFAQAFISLGYSLNLVDSASTGHKVFGWSWNHNQYWHNNAWGYDGTDGIESPTPLPAVPTVYWAQKPTNSTTGGALYTCVYIPNSSTCNIGS